MKRYFTSVKTSSIITYLRDNGYKISDHKKLYTIRELSGLIDLVNTHNMIIILCKDNSSEIITPGDIDMKSVAVDVTDKDEEDTRDHIANKYINNIVLSSLKRANINNDTLLSDMEQQASDIDDTTIAPDKLFIMEKESEQ